MKIDAWHKLDYTLLLILFLLLSFLLLRQLFSSIIIIVGCIVKAPENLGSNSRVLSQAFLTKCSYTGNYNNREFPKCFDLYNQINIISTSMYHYSLIENDHVGDCMKCWEGLLLVIRHFDNLCGSHLLELSKSITWHRRCMVSAPKLSKGQSPTWTFLIKICYSLVQTIFSIISIASIDIVFSLMQRPYEIHASTSLSDVQHIFTSESVPYPTSWSRDMVHVLQRVRKSLAVKFFESILIYSNNLWLSALFKIKSFFKDFIF